MRWTAADRSPSDEDEPIGAIYFPESGYVSLIAVLDNGDAAEVGLIGAEGLVGVAVVLGAESGCNLRAKRAEWGLMDQVSDCGPSCPPASLPAKLGMKVGVLFDLSGVLWHVAEIRF